MRKKALVFLLSLTVVACSVFFLGVSPKEKSVNLSLKLATLDSSSPQYQTSLATDLKFGFNPQRNSKPDLIANIKLKQNELQEGQFDVTGGFVLKANERAYSLRLGEAEYLEHISIEGESYYYGLVAGNVTVGKDAERFTAIVVYNETSEEMAVRLSTGTLQDDLSLLAFGEQDLLQRVAYLFKEEHHSSMPANTVTNGRYYDSTNYRDSGRAYTSILNHQGTPWDTGLSSAVMSVGSYFGTEMGTEKDRLFSRNAIVVNQFNKRFGRNTVSAVPTRVDMRLIPYPVNGQTDIAMEILSTSPDPTNTNGTSFVSIVFDLADYKWQGTGLIGSVVNLLAEAFGGGVTVTSGGHWDKTVTIRGAHRLARMELPSTVSYRDADHIIENGVMKGRELGVSARFTYRLPKEVAAEGYMLWPQAQIDYMVYDLLDNIWSVSTGAAHIPHQVGR